MRISDWSSDVCSSDLDREVVLDHEDRALPSDAGDERGDALDVLLRHAGGRLVEQQQLRLQRQRGGDLQRPFTPVRQFARLDIGKGREADVAEILHGLLVEAPQHRFGAPEVEALAAPALQGDANVFQRAHVREDRRDLKGPGETQASDLRRSQARDVLPLVDNAAGGRLEKLREKIEAGRSDEPTSELQSLMRISYAVFCLKKNNYTH